MKDKYFRRKVKSSPHNPNVLIDSELEDKSYVESFGLEWTERWFCWERVHVTRTYFRRFLLPKTFLDGKTVVDVGCGNGRIGRLVHLLKRIYRARSIGFSLCFSGLLRDNKYYFGTGIRHKPTAQR